MAASRRPQSSDNCTHRGRSDRTARTGLEKTSSCCSNPRRGKSRCQLQPPLHSPLLPSPLLPASGCSACRRATARRFSAATPTGDLGRLSFKPPLVSLAIPRGLRNPPSSIRLPGGASLCPNRHPAASIRRRFPRFFALPSKENGPAPSSSKCIPIISATPLQAAAVWAPVRSKPPETLPHVLAVRPLSHSSPCPSPSPLLRPHHVTPPLPRNFRSACCLA